MELSGNSILILSPFERCGTNLILDTVRRRFGNVVCHNEPWRMDIKPFGSDVPDSIIKYKLKTLGLRNGKDLHVYKETCLYDDFDYFVNQFTTNMPIILATRSWLEILLSFQKSNLFQRWGYDFIYQLIRNSIKNSSLEEIFDIYYSSDISEADKLVTLMLINSFFIAQGIIGNNGCRRKISFPADKETILSSFSEVAEYLGFDLETIEADSDNPVFIDEAKILDTTFVTTARVKHSLTLAEEAFYKLKAKISGILDIIGSQFGPMHVDIMKDLIHFDENQLNPSPPPSINGGKTSTELAYEDRSYVKRLPSTLIESDWFYSQKFGINISKTLTTNREYVDFLNDLLGTGEHKIFNWLPLLINCNMSEARGGRIYYDVIHSTFVVRAGFENYPVYWISWLGSFLYCYAKKFKLPSLEIAQWIAQISVNESNIGERFGDATPVGYFLPNTDVPIYDSNGNLMIFTHTKKDSYPATFMASGFSWKDHGRREQSRLIWETSRRIGVRSTKNEGLSDDFDGYFQRIKEIVGFFESIPYDLIGSDQIESRILDFILLFFEEVC